MSAAQTMSLDATMLATRSGGNWISDPGAIITSSVEIDSRSCTKGSLFAALSGQHADGHDYLHAAAGNGAVAALVERADIFDDVSAIQAQFHLLLRTIPSGGLVLAPSESDYVSEVLHMGCWSPVARIGDKPPRKPVDQDNGEHWSIKQTGNSSAFEVLLNNKSLGSISWSLKGAHNRSNALNAIAASRHAGVPVDIAIAALNDFSGVKRRMEVIYEDAHTTIYDDFAHHPTAIRTTLQGLRDLKSGCVTK